MAAIVLKHVTKRFGQGAVVKDLSVEIPDRAFLSLVGPSGCGKTTTLRMIAGLERAHDGEIWFDKERVDYLPAHHRDIAMVFQSYALYPHMDVAENMGFPLRMMGWGKGRIAERVHSAANRLSLVPLLNRRPRELSGGQRQRVAIGRAMVRDASVFLMDEPLSNLDAQLRVEMRGQIRQLQYELKRTFVYVTHDQAEALTMSDLVGVMDNGVLQQIGSPGEIYNRPTNLMVAGFVGSPRMNFFQGDVRASGDGLDFLDSASEVSLPLRRWPKLTAGQKVIVGARPESLALVDQSAVAGAVQVDVLVVERLGSDTYLTVRNGQRTWKVRTAAESDVAMGDCIWCRFTEAALHLFDQETERALSGT
jgi:multiple sugar transport system ATP-binding protein